MVHGKFLGSFHLVAPVATNRCGTFCWFTYLWMAVLVGVPERLEQRGHLVLLDQLSTISTALGGL